MKHFVQDDSMNMFRLREYLPSTYRKQDWAAGMLTPGGS